MRKILKLSIFFIKYNEVISTKNYIVFTYIFNLENDRFGIISSSYTQINKIEDKELKKITEINMDRPNYEYKHSILIPSLITLQLYSERKYN
jgi:hypothetical protein